MKNSLNITKHTYVGADALTTKELTFDLLDGLYGEMQDLKECHGKRLTALEKRKLKDRSIASGAGLFGGALAFFGSKLFKLFGG